MTNPPTILGEATASVSQTTPSQLEAIIAGPHPEFAPSIEWGMTATCLGAIALMLFFLPILSIPISSCGLAAGLGGVIRGLYRGKLGMRWSLIGSALSSAVLVLGIILVNAPVGETPSRAVPRQDWQSSDHPFVSPPATR